MQSPQMESVIRIKLYQQNCFWYYAKCLELL